MAERKVKVTGPDGRVFNVGLPEGVQKERALDYILETQYGGTPPEADARTSTHDELQPRMGQAPGQAPEQQGSFNPLTMLQNIGAGVNRGVMDLVNLPVSLYNMAAPSLGLRQGARVEDALGLGGVAKRASDPAPGTDTWAERAGYTGGQWLAPVPPIGKVGNVGKAMQGPREVLTQGQPLITKADAALATGAGLGGEAGRALGAEDDSLMRLASEMAGGATGVGAMYSALRALSRSAQARPGYGWLQDAWLRYKNDPTADIPGLSPEQRQALNVIAMNASNPDLAIKNLEEALSDPVRRPGSLGQLTKDQGVFNTELLLEKGERATENLDRLYDVKQQGADRLERDITHTGGPFGDKESSVQKLQSRIGERVDTLESRIGGAGARQLSAEEQAAEAARLASEGRVAPVQQAAEQAEADWATSAQPFTDAAPTDVSASVLKQTLGKEAKDYWDTNISPLWETLREGAPVPTAPARQAVDKFFEKLDPEERRVLTAKYGKHLETLMDDAVTELKPDSLKNITSDIGNTTWNAKASGEFTNADRLALKLRDALDDSLEYRVPLYREARKAEEAFRKKYKPKGLQKASLTDRPETFVREAGGWKGDKGAAVAREINTTGNPTVVSAAEDSLRSTMAPDVSDPEKLIRNYGSAIEAFPLVKAQTDQLATQTMLRDLTAADLKTAEGMSKAEITAINRELDATQKAITKKTGVLTKTATDDLRKFMDDPDKMIKGLLKNNSGAGARQQLLRLSKTAKMKGAQSQFKQSVRRQVYDLLTGEINAGDFGRESVLRTQALREFNDMVPALRDSKALPPAEINGIRASLQHGADIGQLRARQMAIRESTSSDAYDNLLASVVAASVSPMLGSKQSLMINGALRRAFKAMVTGNRWSDAQMAAYTQYMADPESVVAVWKQVNAARKLKVEEAARITAEKMSAKARARALAVSQAADDMSQPEDEGQQ